MQCFYRRSRKSGGSDFTSKGMSEWTSRQAIPHTPKGQGCGRTAISTSALAFTDHHNKDGSRSCGNNYYYCSDKGGQGGGGEGLLRRHSLL